MKLRHRNYYSSIIYKSNNTESGKINSENKFLKKEMLL